ncbi:MAG: hypothetical protein MUP70_16425, partial [Candidatus Aminicenantes bacterium]|nr:hypothetical protein [Candidatus Aminicenantes bacterium]
ISETDVFKEREEKFKNLDFKMTFAKTPGLLSDIRVKWKDYIEKVYDNQYKTMEILSSHMYFYGKDRKNRLSFRAAYNRMYSGLDVERIQAVTNFLQHINGSLYMNGIYAIVLNKSYGLSHFIQTLDSSLNHQLFLSLNSSAQVGGRIEKSDNQDIYGIRGQLSVNYNKKIPTGSLRFNFTNSLDFSSYSSKLSVVNRQELLRFSAAGTIILPWSGINKDSIQVTSPDLGQVYIQDYDYQVDVIKDTIIISRLPEGTIPWEGEILIHFQNTTIPDFRMNTHFSHLNIRLLLLKYFYVQYNRRENNHFIKSDFIVSPFENYTRITQGVGLLSPLLKLDYSLEDHRSNFIDYESKNLNGSLSLRLLRLLRMTAFLNQRKLKYIREIYFSDYNAYGIEGTLNLTRNISASTVFRSIEFETNLYSRHRDSIVIKGQWAFRQISINVLYEHILVGYQNTERLRNYFSIMIRRRF